MIKWLLVYRHPVYFRREGEDRNPALIMFTGRRWAMLSTISWLDEDQLESEYVWTDEEIHNMLLNFHVYQFDRNLGVRFLSQLIAILFS